MNLLSFSASASQSPSTEVEKAFLASKEQLAKIVVHEKAFAKDPTAYADTYLNYITGGYCLQAFLSLNTIRVSHKR